MNTEKIQRAVHSVAAVVKPAIAGVLSQRISEHYSEAGWEKITTEIIILIGQHLQSDFDFNKILSEGDICDHKGNVNAEPIIAALQHMAHVSTRPGAAPQLNHLANNVTHVFTQLGHLRPRKEAVNGEEA